MATPSLVRSLPSDPTVRPAPAHVAGWNAGLLCTEVERRPRCCSGVRSGGRGHGWIRSDRSCNAKLGAPAGLSRTSSRRPHAAISRRSDIRHQTSLRHLGSLTTPLRSAPAPLLSEGEQCVHALLSHLSGHVSCGCDPSAWLVPPSRHAVSHLDQMGNVPTAIAVSRYLRRPLGHEADHSCSHCKHVAAPAG